MFTTLQKYKQPMVVRIADASDLEVEGIGTIEFIGIDGKPYVLSDVLYLPRLAASLLSLGRLLHRGGGMVATSTSITLLLQGSAFAQGELLHDGMIKVRVNPTCSPPPQLHRPTSSSPSPFSLQVTTPPTDSLPSKTFVASSTTGVAAPLTMWHRRLAHFADSTLRRAMATGYSVGMEVTDMEKPMAECGDCARAKITRQSFGTVEHHSVEEKLALVLVDLCGPFKPARDGSVHFLAMVDDGTRYAWVMPLSSRDQAPSKILSWIPVTSNKAGKQLQSLRTDNAGEFRGDDFNQQLIKMGVTHEWTLPYTSEQVGVVERLHRTMQEGMFSCLLAAGLDHEWWPHALEYVCWVRNRMPSRVLPNNMSPYAAWHGCAPTLSMARVFGCMAVVYVVKEKRRKGDFRGVWGMFVGISTSPKGWHFWLPETGVFQVARDAIFFEEMTLAAWQQLDSMERITPSFTFMPHVTDVFEGDVASQGGEEENDGQPQYPMANGGGAVGSRGEGSGDDRRTGLDVLLGSSVAVASTTTPPSSFTSTIQASELRGEEIMCFTAAIVDARQELIELYGNTLSCFVAATAHELPPEPSSIHEALSGPFAAEWRKAMDEELQALVDRGTWQLVELPSGKRPVGVKWILRVKTKADGSFERCKARLVARGFTQIAGEDFGETFAPVTDYTTARMLLSVAACRRLHLRQLDIKNAFLYGDLDAEVYMLQPPGYEDGTGRVCKLIKSLYGLKQSPRMWYHRLRDELESLGFLSSSHDEAFFIHRHSSHPVYMIVYVDDIILASSSEKRLDVVVRLLQECFTLRVMPTVEMYLGMNITCGSDGSITLSQHKYLESLMEKFAVPPGTSSHPLFSKAPPSSTDAMLDETAVRTRIGSLQFAASNTRPDIALAVSRFAQQQCDISPPLCRSIEKTFQYLRGTAEHGLRYGGEGMELQLVGYSDSAHGGDTGSEDKRATYGWVFLLGGSAISWASKRFNSITLSTAESEFMAAKEATLQAIHLRCLLEEMGVEVREPTPLHVDNTAAITLSVTENRSRRMKHVAIAVQWLREQVQSGVVELRYIPSGQQVADFLTKWLPRDRFEACREGVGLKRGGLAVDSNTET